MSHNFILNHIENSRFTNWEKLICSNCRCVQINFLYSPNNYTTYYKLNDNIVNTIIPKHLPTCEEVILKNIIE